ncbi:PaaI family thioesterase [Corynebacterium sp. UBA2622]|uniref:PaaI family thioesterase n=1 Tax=Corynebacterium sp. UBA2622 TaxID=1946393 RepID=UPI0025BF544A|nr:PaaI family thioesterase [Corynebacterium sp. UBA2622]
MKHRLGSEILEEPLTAEELDQLRAADTGLSHTLGIVLTYVARDRVEGYVEIGPQHHQPMGLTNGGLYCSVGETLGSMAAVAASGAPAVGMSNCTDFLRGVSQGRLNAVAKPVHLGSTTHLWRIEMKAEGNLVATTNLKLMILKPR